MKPTHGFPHLDAGGFLPLGISFLGPVGDCSFDIMPEWISKLI